MKGNERSNPEQARFDEIDADEASQLIKKYAAKQQIRIELSEEQMEALLKQWNDQNPRMPAEITFHAGERVVAELRVAGYRYRGDTCCV